MSDQFSVGDKVKFQSAKPGSNKEYTGPIVSSSNEPVGDGTTRFGYWIETGTDKAPNRKWVEPKDLQKVE